MSPSVMFRRWTEPIRLWPDVLVTFPCGNPRTTCVPCGAFHHPSVNRRQDRTAPPVNHCKYKTAPVVSTPQHVVLDKGRNGLGSPLKPSNSAPPPVRALASSRLLVAPPPLRCCVFMLIPFGFFGFFCTFILYFYTSVFSFQLFPWQDYVVLVVPRLNEECVQKPVTERTHSEGTSQHKGRRNTAGVSFFSCSVSCLLNTVVLCRQSSVSVARRLDFFFFFCFLSLLQQKRFVCVLVVWMTCVFFYKNDPSLWSLRWKRVWRTWRSLTLEARRYEFTVDIFKAEYSTCYNVALYVKQVVTSRL